MLLSFVLSVVLSFFVPFFLPFVLSLSFCLYCSFVHDFFRSFFHYFLLSLSFSLKRSLSLSLSSSVFFFWRKGNSTCHPSGLGPSRAQSRRSVNAPSGFLMALQFGTCASLTVVWIGRPGGYLPTCPVPPERKCRGAPSYGRRSCSSPPSTVINETTPRLLSLSLSLVLSLSLSLSLSVSVSPVHRVLHVFVYPFFFLRGLREAQTLSEPKLNLFISLSISLSARVFGYCMLPYVSFLACLSL